ncbi:hypothetical protein [Plantactinospora sp. DSM 117369]
MWPPIRVEPGFRATMTARPGNGDEVVELLLAAPPLSHAAEQPRGPRAIPCSTVSPVS